VWCMKAYRKTDNYTLYLADAWEVLDSLPENSIDAVVTDPPYEIGFMNKGWDNTGVAFDRTTWEKVLRVLKPGGHILAFNHSRTFHRMAVAIEDAGFEIRDTIMWLYGSGFPKSHDISKAIDKVAPRASLFEGFAEHFAEQRNEKKLSQKTIAQHFPSKTGGLTGCVWNWENGENVPTVAQWKILQPMLNLSNEWLPLIERIEAERKVVGQKPSSLGGTVAAGERNQEIIDYHKNKIVDITTPATEKAKQWEGWGTALKPAYEPILLARKPIPTTVADNVLTHGVGGLNIDECRVTASDQDELTKSREQFASSDIHTKTNNDGRFLASDKIIPNMTPGRFPANIIHDGSEEATSDMWDNETDNDASRYFYTAKASKKDRDEGLRGFEKHKANQTYGKGLNTETKLVTQEQIKNAQVNRELRHNIHPTVKPTDLMQYLIRLIAPKGATVLDLFMGSGSTGKAAMIENVERDANYHFIGIDRTEEYMPIAEARIEFGLHYLAEKPKADGVVHTDQIDLFSLL
jgi:DNA modification methylase